MSVTVATRDNLGGGTSIRSHGSSGAGAAGTVNLRSESTGLVSSPNNDPVAASLRNARRTEKIFKKIKDIEFSTIEISKSSQQQQSIPPLPPLTISNNNNHHLDISNASNMSSSTNGSTPNNNNNTKNLNNPKSILKSQSTEPSASGSTSTNPSKKISISFGANTVNPNDNGVSSGNIESHPRIPEEKIISNNVSTLPQINITNSGGGGGGAESSASNYHQVTYKPPGSSVPSQRVSSIPVSIKSYNSLNNNNNLNSTTPSLNNTSNNAGSNSQNETNHFFKQPSSLNSNKIMTNSRSMLNADNKPNGNNTHLLTPVESSNLNPAQDRSPKTSLSNMSKSSFSSQQASGKNHLSTGPTSANTNTTNTIFDIETTLSRKNSANSNSLFTSNANSSNRTNSTVSIRDNQKSNSFRKNSNNAAAIGSNGLKNGSSQNQNSQSSFIDQFETKPVFSKSLANKIANAKKMKTKSLPPSLDSTTTNYSHSFSSHLPKRYNHNSRMSNFNGSQSQNIGNNHQNSSQNAQQSHAGDQASTKPSTKHPSFGNATNHEKGSATSEEISQTSKYTLLIQNKYKNNRKT